MDKNNKEASFSPKGTEIRRMSLEKQEKEAMFLKITHKEALSTEKKGNEESIQKVSLSNSPLSPLKAARSSVLEDFEKKENNAQIQVIKDTEEAMKIHKTLISSVLSKFNVSDSLRKFSGYLSDLESCSNLINTPISENKELKIEAFSPIEILRRYSSTEFQKIGQIMKKFPEGIYLIDFMLINFHVLLANSNDLLFLLNGTKELFRLIVQRSSRLAYPLLKKYIYNAVLTEKELKEIASIRSTGIFSEIQEERFICEKANSMLFNGTLGFDHFLLQNMGSIKICFDDFYSFFMNTNAYAFDPKAMLKELKNDPNPNEESWQAPLRFPSLNPSQIHERNKQETERISRLVPLTSGLHPTFHQKSLVQIVVIKECSTLVSLQEHGTFLGISSAKTLKNVLELELNPIYRNEGLSSKEIMKVCYNSDDQMLGCTTSDGFMSFWAINPGFRVDDEQDPPIIGSNSITVQENCFIKGGFEYTFALPELQTNLWYSSLLKGWLTLSVQNDLFLWEVTEGYKFNQSEEKVWKIKRITKISVAQVLKETEERFVAKQPKRTKLDLKNCGKISDVFEIEKFESIGIATFDREVLLYSVAFRTVSSRISMKTSSAFKVMFCESLSLLIPCCFNSTLTLLTLDYSSDSTTAAVLRGHVSSLTAVELFDDLQILVTVDENHFVKLWDLQQFRCKQTFQVSSHSKILCIKRIPETNYCLILTNRINIFKIHIDFETVEENEMTRNLLNLAAQKSKAEGESEKEFMEKRKELLERIMTPIRIQAWVIETMGSEHEIIIRKNNAFLSFSLETGNLKSILDKYFLRAFREFKMKQFCWIGDPLKHIIIGTTHGYLLLGQYFHPEEEFGTSLSPFYPFYHDIQKAVESNEETKTEKEGSKEISKDKIAALVQLELSNKKFSALKHIRSPNHQPSLKTKSLNSTNGSDYNLPVVSIIAIKYVPRDSNLIIVGKSQVSVVTMHQFRTFELVRNVRLVLRSNELQRTTEEGILGISSAEFVSSSDKIILLVSNRLFVVLDYLSFAITSVFFSFLPEKIRDLYFSYQRKKNRGAFGSKIKQNEEHYLKPVGTNPKDDQKSVLSGDFGDDDSVQNKAPKPTGSSKVLGIEGIAKEKSSLLGVGQVKGKKGHPKNKNLEEFEFKKFFTDVEYEKFLDPNIVIGKLAQQLNDVVVDAGLGLAFVFNGTSKVFLISLKETVLVQTVIVPDEIIQNNNGVTMHCLLRRNEGPSLREAAKTNKEKHLDLFEEVSMKSDSDDEEKSQNSQSSSDKSFEGRATQEISSIRACSAAYFLVFSNANGNVYLLPFDIILKKVFQEQEMEKSRDKFFGDNLLITANQEPEGNQRRARLFSNGASDREVGLGIKTRDPFMKMMIQYDEIDLTSRSLETLRVNEGNLLQMIEGLFGLNEQEPGSMRNDGDDPKANRSIVKFSKQEIIGLRGPHSSRVDDIVFHNFRGKKLLMVVFSDGAMKTWDLEALILKTADEIPNQRKGFHVKDVTMAPNALCCRMNLNNFVPAEWSLVRSYNGKVIRSVTETLRLIQTLMISANILHPEKAIKHFSFNFRTFHLPEKQNKKEKAQSLVRVTEKDDSDEEENSEHQIPKGVYCPPQLYQDAPLQHVHGTRLSYVLDKNKTFVKHFFKVIEATKEEVGLSESQSFANRQSSIFESRSGSQPLINSLSNQKTERKKTYVHHRQEKSLNLAKMPISSKHQSQYEESTVVSKGVQSGLERKRSERSLPSAMIREERKELPKIKTAVDIRSKGSFLRKEETSDFVSYFYNNSRRLGCGSMHQSLKNLHDVKETPKRETNGQANHRKGSFMRDMNGILTKARAGKLLTSLISDVQPKKQL